MRVQSINCGASLRLCPSEVEHASILTYSLNTKSNIPSKQSCDTTFILKNCIAISVGPSDVLDIERMSESDVMNGKQVFSFIISMVIMSVPFSNKYTLCTH